MTSIFWIRTPTGLVSRHSITANEWHLVSHIETRTGGEVIIQKVGPVTDDEAIKEMRREFDGILD